MNQVSMFGLRARHSIYTVIVFYIVANPATFKFVRKTLDIKNDDVLFVVHAFVMGVLLYLGSLFIFNPLWRRLEGFKLQDKETIMNQMDNILTGMLSKKSSEENNEDKNDEDINRNENSSKNSSDPEKEENRMKNENTKKKPTVK
tara:strand:- start:49 stop:483 length:435 start_codon:yes stop_codon:yes gene_type:complete